MSNNPVLEAKVKDSYTLGPVTAFSGHEYVRREWRPVPVGSEPAALVHPMLDVREIGGEEIHVTAKDRLAEIVSESVQEAPVSTETETVEAPVAPEPEPSEEASGEEKPSAARRARKAKEK